MGKNSKAVAVAVGGGGGGKRPCRYPWEAWFSGGVGSSFAVRLGVDCVCGPAAMSQTIRVQAWRRGVGVSIVERGAALVVTIRDKRPYPARRRAKAGAA